LALRYLPGKFDGLREEGGVASSQVSIPPEGTADANASEIGDVGFPMFGIPGRPAGLVNLGNTCNSTLQALRSIPELQDALVKHKSDWQAKIWRLDII
jgi:hypothetical protein